ncbi:hypothetical protein L916_14398 [Phytophthora nicotianae]|uniref:RxLR effector protein n=1 Tax=Phytophthora nicotianae TaxID=4792 RepID=W2IG22_PHYNI|nr:hypothetical protein L916_14398 [Phytophthora nicotianae]
MRLYLATLLAAHTALQASGGHASVSTNIDVSTYDVPSYKLRALSNTPKDIPLSRASQTNDEEDEDRVINTGVEKLVGLIRTGASKISEYVNLVPLVAREQPADEILKVFKLEDGMDKALASSNLKGLEDYVAKLNPTNRNDKVSTIRLFSEYYGDDVVAKTLVTAQKEAKTVDMEKTVMRLRNNQLSAWLNSDKSVDDVFKLLKLRQDGYLALASPKLEALDDYMKIFNRVKPDQETLLNVLIKGFGESAFAKMLVHAKDDTRTSELATALQNALLNKWLLSKTQPEIVLKRLRLDKNFMKATTDLNRDTLTRYISMYNTRNPGSQASFIGTLSIHYGDDVVSKALVTASWEVNTKEIAKLLRREQLIDWMNNEKSVDDVFELLKLRDDGYFALTSRKLRVLKDYIKFFNREKAGDETLLKTFTTGFGGESELAKMLLTAKKNPSTEKLATSLQTALFDEWLTSKLQPENVLKKLKLNGGRGDFLSDQNVETLATYISIYNARNPDIRTSLIETLSAHYGDDVVAKTLVIAKYDRATNELATTLQTQLLQTWSKSGKSAEDVFTILKIGPNDFLPMKGQKLQTLYSYLKIYNANNPQDKRSMFMVVRNGFGGDGGLARMVGKVLATSQQKPEAALNYQKELFNQWFNRNIEPSSIYTRFLNVEKASAGGMEKAIVARYKRYYKKRLAQVKVFDDPRRS